MAIIRKDGSYTPLSEDILARWRQVPPAVAGDNMNRDRSMSSRVSPVAPGQPITGHARTVAVMAGDNSAIHAMLPLLQPGEIMVITARGSGDVAIIGEIVVECAKYQKCGGIVIDGAVRDISALRTECQFTPPVRLRADRIKASAVRSMWRFPAATWSLRRAIWSWQMTMV